MVAWWFGGAVDGGYDEILRMLVAAYCRADLGHFLDDLGAFSPGSSVRPDDVTTQQ